MLLVTLAGWVNRHQQRVIEYLVEENRVLKEQVMGRRLHTLDLDEKVQLKPGPPDSVPIGCLGHSDRLREEADRAHRCRSRF